MTSTGGGCLLRIHLGESDRYAGRPLQAEILDRCRGAGIRLVAVYRGIEGFGASTIVHRPGLFGRSKDAPIVVTVADSAAKIEALLPQLNEIVGEGMIALSSAEILTCGDAQ